MWEGTSCRDHVMETGWCMVKTSCPRLNSHRLHGNLFGLHGIGENVG